MSQSEAHPVSAEERSVQARSRGNDLYRKGLFDAATKAYFEAVTLSRNDPAPLSNLSAVQFELGNYAGSQLYAEKALKLLQSEADTSPKKQKLFLRLAKAKLLMLQDAKSVASRLDSADSLHKSAMIVSLLYRKSFSIVDPTRETEPEYYPVGHDYPSPELDEPMLDLKQDLSWLFAGIGDARNFFATLIHLRSNLRIRGTHDSKRFHFTLLDLKPAAIAKILIMLHLLDQTYDTEALACVVYVYGSLIMPAFAYNRLQQTIIALMQKLRKGAPLASWIYVSKDQRNAILRHLDAWKENLYGKYDTRKFRERGVIIARDKQIDRLATLGPSEVRHLPFCEHDDALFWTYGIVMPDDKTLLKHESELAELVKDLDWQSEGLPVADQKALEIIDATWKPNVTLVDIDWDTVRDGGNSKDIPDFCFDSPDVAQKLFNPDEDTARELGVKSFWGWFIMFFSHVSKSIKDIRSRTCVELVVSEMNECLERLRYDAWSTRGEKQGKLDPALFPRTYNRVQISNIPDYVGGALSTFLYGVPLLHPDDSSAVISRILLNWPAFKTHERFLTEYTLLTDVTSVEKHFSVKLREDSSSLRNWGSDALELQDYTMWTVGPSKSLRGDQLISREANEKYFQAHLLKICLPYPRSIHVTNTGVRSPLNITVLFRLIGQFHKIGYPAHWLSEVLGNLLEGTIMTNARAPRKEVLTIKEAQKTYPSTSMCIKPWIAELSTLVSIWKDVLPFGLLFSNDLIPNLNAVRQYTIKFPAPNGYSLEKSVFALVFLNSAQGPPPTNLRATLLDDEQGDRSESAKKIRESGIHVLSTFKWTQETRTVSFWLRSDVVETMKQDDWNAYLWRLDSWGRVTAGVSVRDHVVSGPNWIGEKITLMRLVAAADEDVKEPGLPNSVKRVRQAYVRAIAEYRKRTDPSFTPAKPTKFENWPLGELINEVREVECMFLGAPLLPADLKCQMHVAKLVAGTMPSAEVPSKESLSFLEKFDQHIETRKRYDAWKEKHSKQPKEPRQVNPDCAPQ
ncbi:hypothetical protein D6C86_02622 [Aureobasidium pullulans]|nr:hypothetical protein D6C86_02622 [Aureobasidium pullulans]